MRDPRDGGTHEHDAARPAPPPRASHAGSLLATGVLLAVWLALTLGAPLLASPIGQAAAAIEVGLGLDVLPGPSPAASNAEDDE